jgi:hypothetical protein
MKIECELENTLKTKSLGNTLGMDNTPSSRLFAPYHMLKDNTLESEPSQYCAQCSNLKLGPQTLDP